MQETNSHLAADGRTAVQAFAPSLLALIVVLLAACTQPERATEVLRQQGYTEIQITGYDAFACSKDDTYHTGFTAKSPNGSSVKGVVCAGLMFKGSTIRFD
jgi:hypothetical protein